MQVRQLDIGGFGTNVMMTPKLARAFPGGGLLIAGCGVRRSTPSTFVSFVFAHVVSQSTGLPMTSFGSSYGSTIVEADARFSGACVVSVVYQSDGFLLLGDGNALIVGVNNTNQSLRRAMAIRLFYSGQVDASFGDNGVLLSSGTLTPSSFSSTGAVCGFQLPNNLTMVVSNQARGFQNSAVLVSTLDARGAVVASSRFAFEYQETETPRPNITGSLGNVTVITSCVRTPYGFVLAGLAGDYFAAMRLVVEGSGVRLDDTFGDNGITILTGHRSGRFSDRFVHVAVVPSGAVILTGEVAPNPFRQLSVRLTRSGQQDSAWSSVPRDFNSEFPTIDSVLITRTGVLVASGRAITPTSNAMSYAIVAEPEAIPCDAGPQCFCTYDALGQRSCMTQSDFVAPPSVPGSLLNNLINGAVSVNGNLIGTDGGSVSIRPQPYGEGSIVVSGATFADGTLVLQVNQSGLYPVLVSTGGIYGNFSNVVVDTSILPPCYVGSTETQYSPDGSSLSVLVDIHRDNSCLTPPQIAGVAVGAVVGGVLVALLIVYFVRRQTLMYTKTRNEELRDQTLIGLKPNHFSQETSMHGVEEV